MKLSLFLVVFLILITSICDTISQLLLKFSINKLKPDIHGIRKIILFVFRLITIPRLWLAGFFSVLSLFFWLFVLSKADLNFAFSVDSMHYILIALASSFILKEKVGTMRWIGTISIVGGIILVTLS